MENDLHPKAAQVGYRSHVLCVVCVCNVSNGTHPAYPILLRDMHSSWASPSGTILMGGYDSPRTTEKLETNGSTTDSFQLQYDAVYNILYINAN